MAPAELTTSSLLMVVLIALYFLPGVYAYMVKHRSRQMIAMVNVLFGWTIIGWLLTAAWASSSARDEPPGPSERTHRKCPDCAELILNEAKVCKHCGCKSLA